MVLSVSGARLQNTVVGAENDWQNMGQDAVLVYTRYAGWSTAAPPRKVILHDGFRLLAKYAVPGCESAGPLDSPPRQIGLYKNARRPDVVPENREQPESLPSGGWQASHPSPADSNANMSSR